MSRGKKEGYVRRGEATDGEREGDDCKFSAAFLNGKDRQWDSRRRVARGQGLARLSSLHASTRERSGYAADRMHRLRLFNNDPVIVGGRRQLIRRLM